MREGSPTGGPSFFQASRGSAANDLGRVDDALGDQIAVPAGTPLRLWIFSRDVALSDVTGKAINTAGAAISFSGLAGVDQNFIFAVTGALAQAI